MHIYLPCHIAPQTFCTFLEVPLSIIPFPSWLNPQTGAVFPDSGLCAGEGQLQGEELRGDRQGPRV